MTTQPLKLDRNVAHLRHVYQEMSQAGWRCGVAEIHTACPENKAVPRAAPRDPAKQEHNDPGDQVSVGSHPQPHPSRLQPACTQEQQYWAP